jgi:hypothetical protein
MNVRKKRSLEDVEYNYVVEKVSRETGGRRRKRESDRCA